MARARLSHKDVLQVMRLLADVASLKSDPHAQQQMFVDRLAALLGADVAFVYRGEEWRAQRRARFSQATFLSRCDEFFLRYVTNFGVTHPVQADPFCLCSMMSDRPHQTWRLKDVLGEVRSKAGADSFRDLARTVGLHDGMISLFRTGEDLHSIAGVALHRLGRNRRFTDRQVVIVDLTLGELKQLADRGHFPMGGAALAVPSDALSPRLKQIRDLLLQGHGTKQIARMTSLSIWTVREYVSELYKRLQVSGRGELMARYIASGDSCH